MAADPKQSLFTITCNTCGSTDCSINEDGYYDYEESWVTLGWEITCLNCGEAE